MKKNYVFPAIFTKESRGISIEFPDLPGCLSCADNYRQALHHAKEAMHLHLKGMLEDREKIPQPSELENISLKRHEILVMIKTEI